MPYSAQTNSAKVLVTEAGSLLGFSLVQFFLSRGKQVFGVGKIPPPQEILKNPNFTLLDIDIAQPFPQYIPKFDLIVHLLHESTETLKKFTPDSNLTSATNHILTQTKEGTQVILFIPLEASNNFYEKLTRDEHVKENLKLFLCGDIYGPQEPYVEAAKNHPHTFRHHTRHFYYHNELTNIIAQAEVADKIILEDEGQRNVFPTYVDDVLKAFEHFQGNDDSKKVKIIVSESPMIALTCAYEVQKIARSVLSKELKLYFSGPEKQIEKEPHPLVHPDSLGFEPEVKLEEGLKKTFEVYKKDKSAEPNAENSLASLKTHQPPTSRIEDIQKRYQEHLKKPKESTFAKITAKIPVNKSHFGTKRIIFALLIVVFLISAKTGLDIYLASTKLIAASQLVASGDFQAAQKKSASASKSFKAAAKKIKLVTLPAALVVSGKVNAINDGLTSAYLGSEALELFTLGAQNLSASLEIITSPQAEKSSFDLEVARANFQESYLKSTQALKLAQQAKEGNVFLDRLERAENQFKDLSNLSSSASQLVSFLPNFTGTTDKKTYLILIQDNTQLRPGGGFISNFGEIIFEKGKLAEIKIEDIYKIDRELEEQIEPPPELVEKLGLEQLFLRDSNWSLDYAANAATARDFYKKETGKSVDGVVALDLTLIKNLLALTGPVTVSGQTVSAENLLTLTSKQADNVFLAELTTQIFISIQKSISNGPKPNGSLSNFELFNTLRQSLASKHILASFDDKDLSSLVKTKAWSNALPPASFDPADDTKGARDFLALSEANLGANQINQFVERNISYEMAVGRNGSLSGKLKITYTNTSQTDTYTNFLRVYTPFASSLSDYLNGESEDLDEVEITQASNLQVFSSFVEVAPTKSKTVEFTYRIPKTIKLEKASSYNFYVSKQPGTVKDKFNFTFILPENMQIESITGEDSHKGGQNLQIETDLEADRQFEIDLLKK